MAEAPEIIIRVAVCDCVGRGEVVDVISLVAILQPSCADLSATQIAEIVARETTTAGGEFIWGDAAALHKAQC